MMHHSLQTILTLISARTEGYVSLQKNGRSMVVARSLPDGLNNSSDNGTASPAPTQGDSVAPKNCCNFAEAVGGILE
eukprot:scaffold13318_cov193-Alexandrium_tamarense.AAC.24